MRRIRRLLAATLALTALALALVGAADAPGGAPAPRQASDLYW
ncbi:hypothetical protein [Streptacidiphilus monticola]|uniref:Uncharacterized protein n=1 Tax=Streptacidiphilus monticola TaxID=2161674 RepID=A0ABW1G2G5_9ACTN